MFKFTLPLIAAVCLSGCSYMHIHKQDIVQGNIITPTMVSQVHHGMTIDEVKEVMGPPMLANIFSPNRIEYVYTMQPGGGTRSEQRLTCLFKNGRLVDMQQS